MCEFPRIPMIFMGATYINKDASNNYAWTAPCVGYGAVTDDANNGWKRERDICAALRAFVD